jgi:hypothetical protein
VLLRFKIQWELIQPGESFHVENEGEEKDLNLHH